MNDVEIRMNLPRSDKEALQAIADAEGESLSLIVRRYIRRGLKGEGERLKALLPADHFAVRFYNKQDA